MNIPPATPLAGGIPGEETSPRAEERILLQRARAGDPEAFDSLVRQHQERIYGLVYHMTSNR
ncbi:MAG: RNA polymerase sigma factor, partial [Verrucomicrobiota bacterium]